MSTFKLLLNTGLFGSMTTSMVFSLGVISKTFRKVTSIKRYVVISAVYTSVDVMYVD